MVIKMSLSDFEPLNEDTIRRDMKKIISLWKTALMQMRDNEKCLSTTYDVTSDVSEEYVIEIIDNKTGIVYTYDYAIDDFVTENFANGEFDDSISEPGDEIRKDVPSNVREYLEKNDKMNKEIHDSIEKACESMGYICDYDESLNIFKDGWVVTMPYWCSDEKDYCIEKMD